ncbi:MAG: universal stress protein [Desulfatiglans sp.]|jgi:nucleotide-binding universal stress UspA family protein|nr:universal stress protein [Desulfatiglans sp.]
MTGYKKILFPTDLGEESKKIAEHVKLMAEKFGADIEIVYVASVGHYYNTLDMPVAGLEHFETEVVSAANNQIKSFAEEVFAGMKVKTQVLSGNPAEETVEYAEKNGIDLIIMGHSRAGLERILLGSVAHRILKLAPVPVMIVRV